MTLIRQGTRLITQNVSQETAPHGDSQLVGFHWENLSKTTHHFVIRADFFMLYPPTRFPHLKPPTEWERFSIKPGHRGYVPHRYYTVHTHDGQPVVGRELRGEFALA